MLPFRRVGPLVKLGDGELGGKAFILPFVDRMLRESGLGEEFAPHRICVPETWVLATDCFSHFVREHQLQGCAELGDDEEVRRRFLAVELSQQVRASLQHFLQSHELPLAVRSSALSEDGHYHTTAGLYSTLLIPNHGPERLRQLEEAVRLVYASAFFSEVDRYMRKHCIPREGERMAVAIETVVGGQRGSLFYPLVSGVAQSINFFPVGEMNPEDGVVSLVVGLGRRAVAGLDGMRFCPRYPLVRPSLHTEYDIERTTQKVFDAVDLEASEERLLGSETQVLATNPIERAEEHPEFSLVASVWDAEAGIFYDSLFQDGPRVVTFNRLLRDDPVPLASMLRRVLEVVTEGFGLPVEIEFALDAVRADGQLRATLSLLQARPLPMLDAEAEVRFPEVPAERVLLATDRALGHGEEELRDIVFVDPADFSIQTSPQIAVEVATINDTMRASDRGYLLLGPGRWGTSNKAVGTPVRFRHIDQARLVAEIATPELPLEPSQGSHFFHNMVSRSLFYMTVDTRLDHRLDLEWLRAQPNAASTSIAKLIRCEVPVSIRVDAESRRGLVFRKE